MFQITSSYRCGMVFRCAVAAVLGLAITTHAQITTSTTTVSAVFINSTSGLSMSPASFISTSISPVGRSDAIKVGTTASSTLVIISTTSASPTGTPTPGTVFGRFSYAGCYVDQRGFPGFSIAPVDGNMTIEKCTRACSRSASAALHANSCYCGPSISNTTATTTHSGSCNVPCSGNSAEICGGIAVPTQKRLLATDILLSIYMQIFPDISTTQTIIDDFVENSLVFAPTIQTSYPILNNIIITNTNNYSNINFPNNINNINTLSLGDMYTIIIEVTYLAPCPRGQCDFGYDYSTYTSTCTRTFCECIDDVRIPIVPITTTTTFCDECVSAGPGAVTITVPCALVSTSTCTTTMPPLIAATTTPELPPSVTASASGGVLALVDEDSNIVDEDDFASGSKTIAGFDTAMAPETVAAALATSSQSTTSTTACPTCDAGVATGTMSEGVEYTPTSGSLQAQFTGGALSSTVAGKADLLAVAMFAGFVGML